MKLLAIDDFITRLHDLIRDLGIEADVLLLGTSRSGQIIEGLKMAHMPRQAVFLGFPHPNEPLGELIMESIVQEAAIRQSPKNQADWYLVPVWDVDGARINQSWWSHTISIARMIDHWYRPAPSQQVEWTFPLHDQDIRFDHPLPETEAVRRLLDLARPELLVSLHNGVFPGAYALMSPHGSRLAPKIREVFRTHGLNPLRNRPIPYVETLAEGVFGLPYAHLEIDYLRRLNQPDWPIDYDNGGASFDYVDASCLSLVMELPLFEWIEGTMPVFPGSRSDLIARQIAWWESLEQDLTNAFADPDLLQSDHPLLSSPRYFYRRRQSDLATIKHRLADAATHDDPPEKTDLQSYMATLLTVSTQYSQLLRGGGPDMPMARCSRLELDTLANAHLRTVKARTVISTGRDIIRLLLDDI